MATPVLTPAELRTHSKLLDPLDYLPCSTILEFKKGHVIYNQDQPATHLFLVIAGRIKVSRVADHGKQVVVDIYQADEFFGEAALLRHPDGSEHVSTIEDSRLMAWTALAVEDLVVKRPQLGIALLQLLVERTTDFKARIEILALDTIERRLARALLRLSERFGVMQENDEVTMTPLTHELLAQYVGTSREIVTHYMNSFRKQSYLQYSRKGIVINRVTLHQYLQQGVTGNQIKVRPLRNGIRQPTS